MHIACPALLVAFQCSAQENNCPSRKSWVICKPGPWQSQVSAAAARTCLKHLPVSCWHRRLELRRASVTLQISSTTLHATGPYFKAFERRLRQWDKNSLRGAVAMLAQKIWQEGFGSERSSGSARKPKFVSGLRLEASRQDAWRHIAFFNLPEFALHTLPAKARTRNPVSEAAWIARRRKSVKRCLKLNDAPRDMLRLSKSSRKAAGNAISTKHEEATKKLSELKKRRCFQAQQDDLLLRQEQLRPAEHSQCLERRRKADHQAQLESSLRKRRRSQPELPALANMRLGV